MNNFEFKKNTPPANKTPEQTSEDILKEVISDSAIVSSPEAIQNINKEKMDEDPYFDWMMKQAKNNKDKDESRDFNTNASDFVKYIIKTESEDYGEEGLDKALRMIHEDALYLNYLEPRILTLQGKYEEALSSVIENINIDEYYTTAESLLFLFKNNPSLKNNPEEKKEIMKKIESQNKGLYDFIKTGYF